MHENSNVELLINFITELKNIYFRFYDYDYGSSKKWIYEKEVI